MPRKIRKPYESVNLRRLNKFDLDGICSGRPSVRKLHPTKYAKARNVAKNTTLLVNAMIRDGATLAEVAKLLNKNKSSIRNRYYGLADYSHSIDQKIWYRMHLGAKCDLDYVVNYENLPDLMCYSHKRYKDIYGNKTKHPSAKEKRKTLRELLNL